MQLVDANDAVVARYEYDPYGKIVGIENCLGANSPNIAEINPLRYRGYYYDTETELYYLQSRYYDPEGSADSSMPTATHVGEIRFLQPQKSYEFHPRSVTNGWPILLLIMRTTWKTTRNMDNSDREKYQIW